MITQARLKELLRYDPSTGLFTWRKSRGPSKAGSVAGTKRIDGYIRIKIDGSLCMAHRLVWLYMTGALPRKEIDHKNCRRDDNRHGNLREASRSENNRNASHRADNSSGHKGISWHAVMGEWVARIQAGGVRTCLGYFDILEDAAAAYAEASARHHKEFGRLT